MRPAISILGGDLRQVYLARLLSEDGWKVITWGLEKGGGDGGAPLWREISCCCPCLCAGTGCSICR